MIKPLILFGISKPQIYSFANLLGVLELHNDILENYEIITYRGSIYKLESDSKTNNKFNLRERPFIILPFSIFSSQKNLFYQFIKNNLPKLKKFNKNILIIAGGWHCTGSPEEIFKLGANFVITGEAEKKFPELLRKIYLNYKRTSNFIKNQIIYDKEDVPIDLDKYPPYSEKFRVFCPIEISRGCPFRCKFCQSGNYWNSMRHASINTIVKWIEKAVQIRYDRVWITSPNSFAYGSKNGIGTNPEAVKELLKKIRKIPNLEEIFFGSFPSEVRPEFVTKEMMDACHPYINNKTFSIGAQSSSNELLKKIHRGHNFKDVLNAVDLILDYNYGCDIDFIFGLPGETEKDKEITIDFFRSILKSSKKIRIHTHTFMPLPGTPFKNEPQGSITPELEKIIGQLTTRNKAFGQYKKQSELI